MITQVKVGTEELSAPPFFFGLGSCFVANLESHLSYWGYKYQFNPLGTSFNPASIAKQLRWLLIDAPLSETYVHEGVHHQLDAANQWQSTNPADLHQTIDAQKQASTGFLHSQSEQPIFIISFGTAHAWFLDNTLVNNCHKLPGHLFKRRLLTVDYIIEEWKKTLDHLPANAKLIFTVSPVKYTKIGLQENFLGKSILRQAIYELEEHPNVLYFPSYEIITDELRDYAFYESNGTHPNKIAVEVVMKRFKSFLQL